MIACFSKTFDMAEAGSVAKMFHFVIVTTSDRRQ